MPSIPLLIFERRGRLAEQLRSRLNHRPIRIREARNVADCRRALRGVRGSLAVLNFDSDALTGLQALRAILDIDPQAAVVVLAERPLDSLAPQLLELGATHVAEEPGDPEILAGWLDRFLARAAPTTEAPLLPELHEVLQEDR